MKINDTKIQNNLCHFFGKKTSITLAILHLACFSFAAQRTWTGGTSTDWSTASNWSGSTAPLASDSVTISSGTYNCILDANHTVKQLTVSDSLDLNGYTLTVTYNSTFNSGSYVSNGTLTIYESTTGSTSTFTSGTIAATLNVTASAIKFSGTTFTSSVTAVKKGSSSSTGNGGSTFSSTVILIDSSTANWTFANTTADTWSNRVEVKEASSGPFFLQTLLPETPFQKV